jgi:hypothetical protein
MFNLAVTLVSTFFFAALQLVGQGALPALAPLAARDAFTVWLGQSFDGNRMAVSWKGVDEFDWSDPLIPLADGESLAVPMPADSVADVMAMINWGTRANPVLAIGFQRLKHPEVTPQPHRGTTLIVVDTEAAAALADLLEDYRQALRREGFATQVHTVAPSASPIDAVAIRRAIRAAWVRTDIPRLTHVVLIGAVPVPYSGGFNVRGAFPNPDGHAEHGGAWPADAYYGDMDRFPGVDAEGLWTDSDVNISSPTVANRTENRNVPGDGKFDQSQLPSDVELAVGRIDMRKLWALGVRADDRTREIELLRSYLARNIAWRSNAAVPAILAGVDDNFGLFERRAQDVVSTEAFAASGLRSWMGIVNDSSAIRAVDFVRDGASGTRPILDSATVLLAYGCGPGGYSHCDFVANVDLLKNSRLNARFVLLFGSYFGDSDSDDNLMRTILGVDGNALTVGWAGRPHWFLHPMAADATIGECLMLTQNNAGTYLGATAFDTRSGNVTATRTGERGIHIHLIGDPTLRLPPAAAPAVEVQQNEQGGITFRVAEATVGDSLLFVVDQASNLDGHWARLAVIRGGDVERAVLTPAPTARHIRVRALSTRQRNAGAPFERIVASSAMVEIQPLSVHEHVVDRPCINAEWYDLLGRRSTGKPTSGVWLERCMGWTKVVTF